MYIKRDGGAGGIRLRDPDTGDVICDVSFNEDGVARCSKKEGEMLAERYEGIRIESRERAGDEEE